MPNSFRRSLLPLLPAAALLSAPFAPFTHAAPPALTADREEPLYEPGEEITVQIEIAEKPATRYGRLEWKAHLNGVNALSSGGGRLKQGSVEAVIPVEHPGFVTLTAEVTPDTRLSRPKKESASFVAAVAPEQLQPGAPAPDDFGDYWKIQKESLASVPAEAELTPKKVKDNAALELFEVQVKSFGPMPASGYYARPEGAAEKSLPAILLLHSGAVRSADKARALLWAGKNMLALDLNTHGVSNGQPAEFYRTLASGELKGYQQFGIDSRDSFYFNSVYLRALRALDFLAAQPEWDGRTLVVLGHHLGGAQAIVAAALDPRVTFYAAAQPAMSDLSADLASRTPGWPSGLLPKSNSQKAIIREVIKYYDLTNFAPLVKAPGIVSVGFRDRVCPPSSVYATYNALGGEKQLVPGYATEHGFDPETAEAFNEAITTHLNR